MYGAAEAAELDVIHLIIGVDNRSLSYYNISINRRERKRMKVSYDEIMTALNLEKDENFLEKVCSVWSLEEPPCSKGAFFISGKVRWIIYLLAFPCAIIKELFYCLWCCGLKNFDMPTRYCFGHYVYYGETEKYNNLIKLVNKKKGL